jgi:tetratricopeptide (TPR) repeat protein
MDPDFSVTHWFLGQLHVQRRDYDAAVEALEEASRLSGGASRMVADLGSAYALRGDRDRARALLDRLRELSSQGVHVSRYEYSVVHAGLGEFDQAIRELEAALEERTWQVVNMNIDPMLRPVRDDPRYPGLVRRMGLPGR